MNRSWAGFVIALVVLVVVVIAACGGCTAQNSAKSWGGTAEVDLPQGEKLVNISWKDSDLWYLVRPMREDEEAETYEYKAQSSWGVFEGKVVIREHK